MSVTISLTGALFSTISPTLAITSSRPAVISRSCHDRRDEVVDERQHDQQDGEDHHDPGGDDCEHEHGYSGSASSTITSSEPP